MSDEEPYYVDDSRGTVRPYAFTRGRTRPRPDLDMATQVVARPGADRTGLEPEQIELVQLCQRWQSVAELAAYLGLPMHVVKLMLSELLDRGVMAAGATRHDGGPRREVLEQVLVGLRALG
jgi:hypothetical protein